LIDSRLSSDAVNDIGNNNSTPGIHGLNNDKKYRLMRRLRMSASGLPEKIGASSSATRRATMRTTTRYC
jgi:hypothetical protein